MGIRDYVKAGNCIGDKLKKNNDLVSRKFSSRMVGLVGVLVLALPVLGLQGLVHAQACGDFMEAEFKKTTLLSGLESPMKMALAKDGRIFFSLRTGSVMVLKPGATTAIKILSVAVANNIGNEDGVLGIALDPKFESNSWIYVYHTLETPIGFYLSRYTLSGDALIEEKKVLTIPHPFSSYAGSPLIIHAAGAIEFDPSGNILISTGDLKITSGGFDIPVNENTTNFDAQATSANSNSLLGKILRITPKDDGTYSIPTGNLFPAGTANTKPEIYAMGTRNPFTLTIDPQTGWAYSGEVGPDGVDGPIQSQDEINQIKLASNLGWPYLSGDNQAYNDMNGKKYNPGTLVNNSKNNDGIKTLPAPTKSLFWFSNTQSSPITGITVSNGRRCIKVGGFYRFNPAGVNPKRLPPAMNNGFFMANHEEDNATLRFFKLGDDGSLASVKTVLTGLARPMDFKIGPDGVLYAIEWGSDNGHWLNKTDGKISKIEYSGACSVTGIVKDSNFGKYEKTVLTTVTANTEIVFPEGFNFVKGYDLRGKFMFDLKKDGAGTALQAPVGERKGLMYLKFGFY